MLTTRTFTLKCMGTADDHERTLTALTASGVIAPTSPLASTANPLWWNGRTPTPPRQLLHKQLVRELYDATPALAHDRQAILLAGPPGAGKSTALGNVLTPEEGARYLHLDADHFKTRLLAHAQEDGSLEAHYLAHPEVQAARDRGEQFFPLELAALVHEESSYLTQHVRAQAIASGANLLIDGVMSDENKTRALMDTLNAHGYTARIIDVEVPQEASLERTRGRWRAGYEQALAGDENAEPRWVPAAVVHGVYDEAGQSKPRRISETVAHESQHVTEFHRFEITPEQWKAGTHSPEVVTHLRRPAGLTTLMDAALADTRDRTRATIQARPTLRPPTSTATPTTPHRPQQTPHREPGLER